MNYIIKNYVLYFLAIPVILLIVIADRYSKKLENETAKKTEEKFERFEDKLLETKAKVNYLKHVKNDSLPLFNNINGGLFILKHFKKDYKKPKRKSVISSMFKALDDYNRKYNKDK